MENWGKKRREEIRWMKKEKRMIEEGIKNFIFGNGRVLIRRKSVRKEKYEKNDKNCQ